MDLKILKVIASTGVQTYNITDGTARTNSQNALTKVATAIKTVDLTAEYEEATGELTLDIQTTNVG